MPLHRSVAVYYATRRPVVGGLRRCRNRFVCPHCSWCHRLGLAARWRVILDGFTDSGLVPSFVVLSLSHNARTFLRVVLADLMAAWRRFRSFDETGLCRAGTDCYAWSLEVVVGGSAGPHPHLRCFTVRWDPSESDPVAQERYITDLWFRTAKSTASRGVVRAAGVTHDYITEQTGGLVDYSLGIPARSAVDQAGYEVRYRHQRTGGEVTLLDLALRVHRNGDAPTGRLFAAAAADLHRRRSYAESKRWKNAAADPGVIAEPSVAAYAGTTDPKPVCIVASSDYLAHKAAIEHWCDTTLSLTRPEFTESLRSLLARCRIEPVTTSP